MPRSAGHFCFVVLRPPLQQPHSPRFVLSTYDCGAAAKRKSQPENRPASLNSITMKTSLYKPPLRALNDLLCC